MVKVIACIKKAVLTSNGLYYIRLQQKQCIKEKRKKKKQGVSVPTSKRQGLPLKIAWNEKLSTTKGGEQVTPTLPDESKL